MLTAVKHHMFGFKVQILTKECGKIFERDKAYEAWQVSLRVPPTHIMVHVIQNRPFSRYLSFPCLPQK